MTITFSTLAQLAVAVTVMAAIVSAVPTLRHAAWELLCMPGRVGEILTALHSFDEVKASNERAVAASERALDEWHGAVDAVHKLAGDHDDRLNDHGRRIEDLEQWRRVVEGA